MATSRDQGTKNSCGTAKLYCPLFFRVAARLTTGVAVAGLLVLPCELWYLAPPAVPAALALSLTVEFAALRPRGGAAIVAKAPLEALV